MAPTPSTIPELICPRPKSSSGPIFLSGATWITRSCVPSRLPSPDPSDLVAPSSPTIPLILPPSPSASPVQELPPPPPPAPTLLTLPPEILLNILWFCSHPQPNLYRLKHDKVYIDRVRRGHPDLPIGTSKAVYASCRTLRNFLLDLECRGAGLRITDISGLRNWNLFPPIWTYSKDISVRWDDSGMTTWPWGVEEQQWTIIKSRSESKYGPLEPQEEPPTPPPVRADLVNKTGEKPKDPKAYMLECRRYLVRPPPPPPPPKKHREWIVEDLGTLLRGCKSLISLDLNFPGALEAFSVVVLGLPDSASIFHSVKTLTLRNGNERCLPTPKKLFVAIARFRGLAEVTVDGNCHGMRSLFSVKERKKRGVFVGEMEVVEGGWMVSQDKAEVLQGLWGWECEALEMPEKPVRLEKCIIRGLPGLGEVDSEGMSSGVWSSERGWPGEVRRELVHGGLVVFVDEVNVGKGDSDSSDDEIIAAVKVNVLTETRKVMN